MGNLALQASIPVPPELCLRYNSEAKIGQLYHDFDWLLALPEALAARYHHQMVEFEEKKEMPHLSTAERIGRQMGRKEGRKEGREEGAVREAQSLLLLIASKRFGPPSEEIRARIAAIMDREQLESLCARVLEAETWLDLLGPV